MLRAKRFGVFFQTLTLCEATARSTKLRKKQFYKSVFYQKKEALLLITTLPCLKVFVSLITINKSKSSWRPEKFAKSRLKEKSSGRMRVASCVASQLLQVTDKLPSFPMKAEFSQIERLTSKPRCRLDRSWNRALANRSLPAQQTRHQDKNCVQLHCRTRGWREAQLQRAKTTIFSTERRFFQSVNMIACHSTACTRKMATLGNHNYQKIRLECTLVAIDRNRSMASQRVNVFPERPLKKEPDQRMKFISTNEFWKFEVKKVKNEGAVSKNVVRVAISPRSP